VASKDGVPIFNRKQSHPRKGTKPSKNPVHSTEQQ
jgi:hypothetical protein